MSTTQTGEFTVAVDAGELFARIWLPENRSSDIPVVLLHDSLGCVDLWRDFPQQLAEQLSRPVVAYDRLGFGQSSPRDALPSDNFIAEEASIFFPALKKVIGFGEYIVFGYSVGGAMAIHIAASDSDCKAVITMSAQAFVEELTRQGIREAQAMFSQPGQIQRLEKYHGHKADWVLDAWTSKWLSPDFADWSLADAIGKVHCPVLAIHGDKDEYGSLAFPEYIAGKVSGPSEKVILKDCGHSPQREKPEELIAAVKDFLKGLS